MKPSEYIREHLEQGNISETFQNYINWLNDEYDLAEFLSYFLGIDLEEAGIDSDYYND